MITVIPYMTGWGSAAAAWLHAVVGLPTERGMGSYRLLCSHMRLQQATIPTFLLAQVVKGFGSLCISLQHPD